MKRIPKALIRTLAIASLLVAIAGIFSWLASSVQAAQKSPFETMNVLSALSASPKAGDDSLFFDSAGHLFYYKVTRVDSLWDGTLKPVFFTHDYGEPKRPVDLADAKEMIKTGCEIPVAIKKELKISTFRPDSSFVKETAFAKEFYSKDKKKFDETIVYRPAKFSRIGWARVIFLFMILSPIGMLKIAFMNYWEEKETRNYFLFFLVLAIAWIICHYVPANSIALIIACLIAGFIVRVFLFSSSDETRFGLPSIIFTLIIVCAGSVSFIETAEKQYLVFFIVLYWSSFIFVRLWHYHISEWKWVRKITDKFPKKVNAKITE